MAMAHPAASKLTAAATRRDVERLRLNQWDIFIELNEVWTKAPEAAWGCFYRAVKIAAMILCDYDQNVILPHFAAYERRDLWRSPQSRSMSRRPVSHSLTFVLAAVRHISSDATDSGIRWA
jgi:hypothetical protein